MRYLLSCIIELEPVKSSSVIVDHEVGLATLCIVLVKLKGDVSGSLCAEDLIDLWRSVNVYGAETVAVLSFLYEEHSVGCVLLHVNWCCPL